MKGYKSVTAASCCLHLAWLALQPTLNTLWGNGTEESLSHSLSASQCKLLGRTDTPALGLSAPTLYTASGCGRHLYCCSGDVFLADDKVHRRIALFIQVLQ